MKDSQETVECDQFLCFFDTGRTGDEEQDRYPVGFGKTRAEAQQMGITNVMPKLGDLGIWGIMQSSFATVAQPQLEPDEFAELGKVITGFFAEKNKLSANAE